MDRTIESERGPNEPKAFARPSSVGISLAKYDGISYLVLKARNNSLTVGGAQACFLWVGRYKLYPGPRFSEASTRFWPCFCLHNLSFGKLSLWSLVYVFGLLFTLFFMNIFSSCFLIHDYFLKFVFILEICVHFFNSRFCNNP